MSASDAAPKAERVAPDGSPYPDRSRPSFERDVQAMFTHIARRYDWFDHLASLGQDYLWRPRALWTLERARGTRSTRRILDIGCGTGDLSRLARHRFPSARVVSADFTRAMLVRAEELTSPAHPLELARASALSLPFDDGAFDVAVSAFVVRNLPSLPTAFRELRRVVGPAGTLLTLEITEPTSTAVREVFHAYFDRVVPRLGAAVQSAGPYRYLPESLRNLPSREEMLRLLRDAGFPKATGHPQAGGIVTTYLAE